jgi:hypothetical protein
MKSMRGAAEGLPLFDGSKNRFTWRFWKDPGRILDLFGYFPMS